MSEKNVVMVLPHRRETSSPRTEEMFFPSLSQDDSIFYPTFRMQHFQPYDMSTPTLRHCQSETDRNVNRLRNSMPDKFTTLVRMHLSFQLDLDGTKLEDMFADHEDKVESVHKKKSTTPFSKKKEKPTFFGATLTQENVAQVYQLIEFLGRPENIATEGLFRKTGNFARQKLLKERLTSKCDLGLDQGTFSPHDCATVLKNFLNELPEPLLTERHYQAHLQVVEMSSHIVVERDRLRARCKQIKTLQLLMLLLPRNNVLLFESLIDLLHRVTKVAENMMTATSLGTVFAPQLLCPRKMAPEELHSISPVITKAVSFMIENGTQIFKVPRELSADIANFWRDMENPHRRMSDSEEQENLHNSNLLSAKKKYGSMQAINNTLWSFSERKSSSDSDSTNDTQMALAELYAHVQSMPNSSKKKKLLKQFNKASSNGTPKKHTRSRTFGESIKKHLPGFHRHKRRGSSEATAVTRELSWAVTKTINIDDDNVFQSQTVSKPVLPSLIRSPAVHIVDLNKSPETPIYNRSRSRKRLSSESSEGSIPEKRPTPDHLPSSENEIKYLSKNIHDRKLCPCTPERHGKPIAMVSPITHHSPITESIKKAPMMTQKKIMTPRSRAPMMLLQSPNMETRESTL